MATLNSQRLSVPENSSFTSTSGHYQRVWSSGRIDLSPVAPVALVGRCRSPNRHSRTDLNWIDQIRFLNSMAMQQEPIEDGGTDSIYFWPIFEA